MHRQTHTHTHVYTHITRLFVCSLCSALWWSCAQLNIVEPLLEMQTSSRGESSEVDLAREWFVIYNTKMPINWWNRLRGKRVKSKKVVDVRLHRVSFGRKRAWAPKAFNNPVPPNKWLVEPSELDKPRKDLEAAHMAALACNASGNVQRYGSSTRRTSLQSDSSSSSSDGNSKVAKSLMLQTVRSLWLSMCQLLQHVQ